MDMAEWLYKIPRVGNDLTFLQYVRKFVAAAKKHHVSLGRKRIICPCNACQNTLLLEDNVVQSHLIRHSFIKDYTVSKFHSEVDPSVTGGSEGNSSTTSTVNERGQQPPSSAATAGGNSANRDYVNIDELLQDMAVNDGDEDGDEQGDLLGPEDAEIFENLANRMDQDDVFVWESEVAGEFQGDEASGN